MIRDCLYLVSVLLAPPTVLGVWTLTLDDPSTTAAVFVCYLQCIIHKHKNVILMDFMYVYM